MLSNGESMLLYTKVDKSACTLHLINLIIHTFIEKKANPIYYSLRFKQKF